MTKKASVPAFTSTVSSLTRLGNSVNGNPRYRVTFKDRAETYITSSDAGFVYGIENRNMRGLVDVYLTRAGRIYGMEPRMSPQQEEIAEAALKLLQLLTRVVPNNVAHYAVEDSRLSLAILETQARRCGIYTHDIF